VTQAIRDAVVDFVRYWSDRAKILIRRLIAWLGIPSSKYYDWRRRYGRCNEHNAKIPRSHWLLDWEKAAILQYQQEHPEEGYRRLAYMMLDAGVVAASPSSVYRVLKNAERLRKRTGAPSPKGCGFAQPSAPHRHWHIDISYLNISGTFYYLCSVLDGYSRYMVHWEIRESMKEADVETVLQRAHERFPAAMPRIISDNGPQFVARDFKLYIRQCGMTHVRTAPFYPQSNGKIESWHKTIKRECIRPKTPLNLADARRIVAGYVQHYNEARLHAGIGYVAPKDRLDGRDEAIRQNRRRKLADAQITRRAAHHTQTAAPRTSLQRSVAAPVLP
jgi:transposase InsO family protein